MILSTISFFGIEDVPSSSIASWASTFRERNVAASCFFGSRLVNFLLMLIYFSQSVQDFEKVNDGGYLLLLNILGLVGCIIMTS